MSSGKMNFFESLAAGGATNYRGGTIGETPSEMLVSIDRKKLSVTVCRGVSARLLLLHTKSRESVVEIDLQEGASLCVTELFLSSAFTDVAVRQCEESRCDYTLVELCSAGASYRADLNGRNAEWRFGGVFAGTDFDRCAVTLNTRHNAADCKSDSMVKGVVSGRAAGEFRGLVYVAPGAQRTDARQQSRNIELGADSHIVTRPQLEIYADDVKCSHGATVGHRDDEALLYMRQRGLSEQDAQRLQIEGFVKDIIMRCPDEEVRAALETETDRKLLKL